MTGTVRDARRKLPAERHGELLARAVAIARSEGLSAVTLRRVAADLGVTAGLVSHYFSAAEMLTAATFRAAAQQDLDAAAARIGAAATAVDKMHALLDYVLDDDGDEGSALWLETWTLARRNPALAEVSDELTERWTTAITAIVAAGVEAGEFTVTGPVDAVARRLLTLIDGLGSQKVVRAVPAAEVNQIARTYLRSELREITNPR
jgi:AcrR family transcriptional regulator